MKTLQEMQKKASESRSIKIILVGILTLLLLIPAGMIKDLILERMNNRDETVNEISDKWGHTQTITGPILTIPMYETVKDGEKIMETRHNFHLLPEELNISGALKPEIRYRGIYKVIVYQSDLDIKGSFSTENIPNHIPDHYRVAWEEAYMTIGIPDMRGIQNPVKILWNKKTYKVNPGVICDDIVSSGFNAFLNVKGNQTEHDFQFRLDLNGSKGIFFTPLGKTTNVSIVSSWNTPSFTGSFLPDERKITSEGFTAKWNILHLNRNYPQQWIGRSYSTNSSVFGTELLFPVDEYQKTMRSAKYAIMFISLTFIIFLLIEIITKKRIHPVQYFLVGVGIIIFYTLLLSFSEQLHFTSAYLISSTAIVTLITYYTHMILKKIHLTLLTSAALIILYAFLYIILQLSDYSLLLGSIGLFITLSVIMITSRKINWYS